MEMDVDMRTTLGSARKHHLDRAARVAGEAFAFEEPDSSVASHRLGSSTLLWLAMAAVAVAALAATF